MNYQRRVLDAYYEKGNFQDWARTVRYEFFRKLVNEYRALKVVVGHNQEDHIETYLMQKERNSYVQYYGINPKVELFGIKVERPILKYSSAQILRYLKKNNIDYAIDKTNESKKYQRNRIRQDIVLKLSKDETKNILEEIIHANIGILDVPYKISQLLLASLSDSKIYFMLHEQIQYHVLRTFILEYLQIDISIKHLEEVNRVLLIKKYYQLGHCYIVLNDRLSVKYIHDYSYEIETLGYEIFDYCVVSNNGTSKQGAYIYENDFPLTIRNYQPGDKIQMRYGTKAINRFFIDNKIPIYERKMWPVVLNSKQEIILVPGIGCNVSNFSNNYNFYVIKSHL